MQFAYNDEDLSVPDVDDAMPQSEELQFVNVSSKIQSENERYKQRVEEDQDLATPISTPDLQAAAKGRVIPMAKALGDGEEYKFNVESNDETENVNATNAEDEKVDENEIAVGLIQENVEDHEVVKLEEDEQEEEEEVLPAENPSYCGYFSNKSEEAPAVCSDIEDQKWSGNAEDAVLVQRDGNDKVSSVESVLESVLMWKHWCISTLKTTVIPT